MKLGGVVCLGDCSFCGSYIKLRKGPRFEIIVTDHRNPVSHRKCKNSGKVVGYIGQHL
jgi:hypothetical protein